MTMDLEFHGAAGTVTGSKYLVRAGNAQLLVDCGLFQGFKPLRLRNWAQPSFDPKTTSAVVLTHAHIDHSGYLPLLIMATGGRVVHHIAAFGPHPENTIVFAGFQAGGTRGAAMLGGAKDVKIHGAYVPIRAEVVALGNLSAHADADEIMAWLKGFAKPPRRVFVTHGEPAAADALRLRIQDELGWEAHMPDHLEKVELRR